MKMFFLFILTAFLFTFIGFQIKTNMGLNTANEVSRRDTDNSPIAALGRFSSNDYRCPMELANLALPDMYNYTLNESIFYFLPELPSAELPIGSIHDRTKQFDKDYWSDGRPIYKVNNSADNWEVIAIDIDNDGEQEKAMTAYRAMTRGPHYLRIVKQGYVLFEFEGRGVHFEPRVDRFGSGFLLDYDNEWTSRDGVRVYYIVSEDGLIKPLWQQKHCGLVVESNKTTGLN